MNKHSLGILVVGFGLGVFLSIIVNGWAEMILAYKTLFLVLYASMLVASWKLLVSFTKRNYADNKKQCS